MENVSQFLQIHVPAFATEICNNNIEYLGMKSEEFILSSDEEIECASNVTKRSTVTQYMAQKAAELVAKDVIAKRKKMKEKSQKEVLLKFYGYCSK